MISHLLALRNETNYLHRLTTLNGIADLSSVVTPELIKKSFCPILVQMSKDKIPNIRLNVAKTIGTIRNRFQEPG